MLKSYYVRLVFTPCAINCLNSWNCLNYADLCIRLLVCTMRQKLSEPNPADLVWHWSDYVMYYCKVPAQTVSRFKKLAFPLECLKFIFPKRLVLGSSSFLPGEWHRAHPGPTFNSVGDTACCGRRTTALHQTSAQTTSSDKTCHPPRAASDPGGVWPTELETAQACRRIVSTWDQIRRFGIFAWLGGCSLCEIFIGWYDPMKTYEWSKLCSKC